MEHSAGEKYFTKAIDALTEAGLPVARIIPAVLDSVEKGKVTIVTAETGSGKTLLANAALADNSDQPVWVLVPRRFLAINAAETIARLSGTTLGEEVGYAIGRKTSDRSKYNSRTKLIFATYGYALSAGILDDPNVKTVVCDEVHEKGIDTSLARAILHRRMETDKSLRVVEMSATVNAQQQAAYWKDVAETAIHHAEGKYYDCDYRHVEPPARSEDTSSAAADQASRQAFLGSIVGLLKEVDQTEYRNVAPDNQRKGIAVFIEGVKTAETIASQLRQEFVKAGMNNVEVATIYADMDDEQRALALAPPKEGNLKVLVGTPVIESGMNIPWLRGGVSNGFAKLPYYHVYDGAEELCKVALPEWRITQQMGRVNRFDVGKFILFSDYKKEDRPQENEPEISRVALTDLIMYAANYGLDPTKLKFDAPVDAGIMAASKQALMRLQLLNEDWTLTEKGQFAIGLPLGPEAAAMMAAAKERFPTKLNDAIELAAIADITAKKDMSPIVAPSRPDEAKEQPGQKGQARRGGKEKKGGGMRADVRVSHIEDSTSDVLDALKAYRKVRKSIEEAMAEWCRLEGVDPEAFAKLRAHGFTPVGDTGEIGPAAYQRLLEKECRVIEDCCAEKNMSVMRYKEATTLIAELHRRLEPELSGRNEPAKDADLVQILLHGSVNHIFKKYIGSERNFSTGKDERVVLYQDLSRDIHSHNKEDRHSVVVGRSDEPYAVTHLQYIFTDKMKEPMTVAGNITRVSREALLEFLAHRPDILTDAVLEQEGKKVRLTGKYFGSADMEFSINDKAIADKPALTEYLSGLRWHKNRGGKPMGTGNTSAVDDVPGQMRRRGG